MTKQEQLQQLGIAFVEHPRLGVLVKDCTVDRIIGDFPISFTRRRYSNTTFCWAHVFSKAHQDWLPMGDPWQCVTPKQAELAREAEVAIAYRNDNERMVTA